MQRLILKVDEGKENMAFRQHIMAFANEMDLELVILRRPQNPQSLNSFDDLLKIENVDAEQLIRIENLGFQLKASYKMLSLNENVSKVYNYVEGEKLGEDMKWSDGMLLDDAYYLEPSLGVHFGESQTFIDSKDFLKVDKIARRYPFLFFDFDDQVMYATDWFCLPATMKKEFVEDLGKVQAILRKYNLNLTFDMTGFDGHLNLEKCFLEKDKIFFKKILG
ncbi:MAG: hypothetical protein JXR88_18990 [Clostridia bacterium]|nr:hypothetical protein [Clostridia bacterium]